MRVNWTIGHLSLLSLSSSSFRLTPKQMLYFFRVKYTDCPFCKITHIVLNF
ncbi:hypothetical protein Hanom_Chr02g00137541 [Helianthus anomalus]